MQARFPSLGLPAALLLLLGQQGLLLLLLLLLLEGLCDRAVLIPAALSAPMAAAAVALIVPALVRVRRQVRL